MGSSKPAIHPQPRDVIQIPSIRAAQAEAPKSDQNDKQPVSSALGSWRVEKEGCFVHFWSGHTGHSKLKVERLSPKCGTGSILGFWTPKHEGIFGLWAFARANIDSFVKKVRGFQKVPFQGFEVTHALNFPDSFFFQNLIQAKYSGCKESPKLESRLAWFPAAIKAHAICRIETQTAVVLKADLT